MKRVILFGGSFDPIHNGHMTMAKAALKQRQADALWFIPTKRNPFKDGSTDMHHRKAMIERMIYGWKQFEVNLVEAHLPEPSYTMDTVKHLQKLYPDFEFEWLIGADQLDRLDEWKAIDALKQSVQFIVYGRKGVRLDTTFPIIRGLRVDTSSTRIRMGQDSATKPSVLRYMMENSLYTESLLHNTLSQQRYDHVCRVRDLALEIAQCHGLNTQQVKCAALTHDLCKEWSYEDQAKHIACIDPKLAQKHPAFYHAFIAADVLSRHYYVKDRSVLRAVKHHVDGASTNPIAMVIYIADKCERGRPYDNEAMIRLAKKNLHQGFMTLRSRQRAYEAKKENL